MYSRTNGPPWWPNGGWDVLPPIYAKLIKSIIDVLPKPPKKHLRRCMLNTSTA